MLRRRLFERRMAKTALTLSVAIIASLCTHPLGTQSLCTAQVSTAQEEPKQAKDAPTEIEKPFLWVIEGEAPQYLLGTIHVPDARVVALHPEIEKALEGAQEIYVELGPKDQLAQQKALTFPAETDLESEVGEDTVKRIDQQLRIHQYHLRG